MFTVVAIENNKCISKLCNVSKHEIPVAVDMFRRDYTHAVIIVENKSGTVVQTHSKVTT